MILHGPRRRARAELTQSTRRRSLPPLRHARSTEHRPACGISVALSSGARDPLAVYVDGSHKLTAAALEPLRLRLAQIDGVSAVAKPVLTRDREGARIDVALHHGPITKAAMDVVRGPLREAAARAEAPARTTSIGGGTSAVYADIADAVARDMRLILPAWWPGPRAGDRTPLGRLKALAPHSTR